MSGEQPWQEAECPDSNFSFLVVDDQPWGALPGWLTKQIITDHAKAALADEAFEILDGRGGSGSPTPAADIQDARKKWLASYDAISPTQKEV